MQSRTAEILGLSPVIPVLTVRDAGVAVPLVKALAAGGLPVVEITLRTDGALDALRRLARECPEAVVGAGTVTRPEQLETLLALGVQFVVSPGVTTVLVDAVGRVGLPYLPGVATPSEAMSLAERGFVHQKFFPAEAAGGVRALRALAAPLPEIRFCPTGGIDAARAPEYLACPNVVCVGGSWVAPAPAVERGDWPAIEALARAASRLGETPKL